MSDLRVDLEFFYWHYHAWNALRTRASEIAVAVRPSPLATPRSAEAGSMPIHYRLRLTDPAGYRVVAPLAEYLGTLRNIVLSLTGGLMTTCDNSRERLAICAALFIESEDWERVDATTRGSAPPDVW